MATKGGTIVVLLPGPLGGSVRYCGHKHLTDVTAERCMVRLQKRYPSITIRLADSLTKAEGGL